MTIKTKLTLNVLAVIVGICAVAITSVAGMKFIKDKLAYLTEQSTPFQTKSLEFQRAIQSAIASLIKVSASNSKEEYKSYRSEAEGSISEVKNVQAALETLSQNVKTETYQELNRISGVLFQAVEARLSAEAEAVHANKAITQKLQETKNKLRELEVKIQELQLNRQATLMGAMEELKKISLKAKDIDSLQTAIQSQGKNQEAAATQAYLANNILISNNEIVAIGLTLEGLSTRVFTANSLKDIEQIEAEIKKGFEKITQSKGTIERLLKKLPIDITEDVKILKSAEGLLDSVKEALLGGSGTIAKIRRQISMREKALQSTEQLKQIVLKQAAQSKKAVTIAAGEQEKAISSVNKITAQTNTITIGLSILVCALITVVSYLLIQGIKRSLSIANKSMQSIANGDLTIDIKAENKDEIGVILQGMDKMAKSVSGIIGNILKSSNDVAFVVDALRVKSEETVNGAKRQSDHAAQIATASEEMSATVTDIAKSATNASELSREVHKAVNDSADVVRETSSVVYAQGEKSKKIGEVISFINDIANKTDLLAVNAAIEAANAGEQGKGFAVVAEEVRKLAEKTTTASQEITKIIEDIQKGSKMAVASMDKLNKSFDGVMTNVSTANDMITQIATAVEEQSATTDEITNNIADTSHIANNIMNMSHDVLSEISRLTDITSVLRDSTTKFKVSGN
ncbi:MAG: hypothetical protein HY756_11465 [Nitrospirae bacterium]|nr:hypothetical protein [Nitrospirota bacterium]